MGSPRPLQIIELGPGRGSLMRDVLKVLEYFGVAKDISAHLVEVSQYMSKLQAQTLGVQLNNPANPPQSGHTASGIPVHWHSHIQDVPRQFSFVCANEFFDALPIHKFQRTADGWREILVDLDPEAKGNCFRYVISRTPTPASTLFIKANEKRDHIEVSPRSAVIIQHLASRLEEDGGIALFVDYGHDGTKTDTFRAFYKHKLHDPLVEPGSADLTADVDFSYLREAAQSKLITFGPVNQGYFLKKMGVDTRLQVLLQNCDAQQQESLQSGYHMIVNHDKMGERFKMFCMFPAVLKDHLAKYPVLGFADLQ